MDLRFGWTRWAAPIFSDRPSPDLTAQELALAVRAAHHAAIRAQNSLILTKRRLYRSYLETAGGRFLDWPRWRAAYLDEYRTSALNLAEINVNDFTKYAS